MKAIDVALICQVKNPEVYLPCSERVGEFRCERLEPLHEDHWVGEHTLRHRIAGDGYTCEEVEGVEETDSASSTEASSKPAPASKPISVRAIAIITVLALAAAFLAAYVVVRGVGTTPSFNTPGDIVGINDELAPFSGQTIENANVDQKALGLSEDKPTTPPAFIFSNGEESKDRQVMDLYVDFNDKESRDLITLNQNTLKALVEDGRIELRLHAVPSGEAYSMYGPETLAETFYYAPDKAWPVLLDILKFADEKNREGYGAGKLARGLAAIAKDNNVDGIDKDSILNGTFASWLLSIAGDDKLAIGSKLPSMYLDDSPIDLPSVDLSSNNSFNKALEQ